MHSYRMLNNNPIRQTHPLSNHSHLLKDPRPSINLLPRYYLFDLQVSAGRLHPTHKPPPSPPVIRQPPHHTQQHI